MVAMDLVIKNGTVATGSGAAVIDVGIEDGQITQLGGTMRASQSIDAEGMFVLPGGVDPHVHLTPPRGPDPVRIVGQITSKLGLEQR